MESESSSLQARQVFHALLDTLDRMRRVVLFDVAHLDAGFRRDVDDRFHRDHAITKLLERFWRNRTVVRGVDRLVQVLQVQLRHAAFQFADQLDWILPAHLDPEDIDLELHVGRKLFDHHVVTGLAAIQRFELEGVIVIRQLDAGLLRLLGRFVASLA